MSDHPTDPMIQAATAFELGYAHLTDENVGDRAVMLQIERMDLSTREGTINALRGVARRLEAKRVSGVLFKDNAPHIVYAALEALST